MLTVWPKKKKDRKKTQTFLMHQIQQRKLTALYYHGNTIHVKCKPNKFNLSNSHGLTAPPDGLQPA